jgi:hypothetical protein
LPEIIQQLDSKIDEAGPETKETMCKASIVFHELFRNVAEVSEPAANTYMHGINEDDMFHTEYTAAEKVEYLANAMKPLLAREAAVNGERKSEQEGNDRGTTDKFEAPGANEDHAVAREANADAATVSAAEHYTAVPNTASTLTTLD